MSSTYCTLFDSNYLTRGLCLYRSLQKHSPASTLIVYCFDQPCFETLSKLNLSGMKIVKLSEFESDELIAVKSSRSKGEYCWTATPYIIRDALHRFSLSQVTYLDADLFFYDKPDLLLEEFEASHKDVLITEHRYTPQYDQSATSGVFCVQFVSFKNTPNGMHILNWWVDRCLEWCFARAEEGKFGDQKYLDDWPTRFQKVHILEHLGGGVAPWNVQQYKIETGPQVNGQPVIFYHFHDFRYYQNRIVDLCKSGYKLNKKAHQLIYAPYIQEIYQQAEVLKANNQTASTAYDQPSASSFSWIEQLKRRVKGTYHVVSV